MKTFRPAVLIALTIGWFAFERVAPAVEIQLYDASAGTLPGTQPWLTYGEIGTVTQTLLGTTGTRLTSDLGAQAGWSNTVPILNTFKNPAFPSLDAAQGFAIDWSMRMISETHSSPNRAGTSMLLLGSDNTGIEICFWTDQVWAQTSNPLFTKGESVNFDTTTASVDYRLQVNGGNYVLYANQAQILTGQTRSYAAFGSSPYTLSNFLFLGDNTTSAGATVEIGSVRLITPIPETGLTGIIVALAAGAVALRRCRKSQPPSSKA